jgi:hypothetical protein
MSLDYRPMLLSHQLFLVTVPLILLMKTIPYLWPLIWGFFLNSGSGFDQRRPGSSPLVLTSSILLDAAVFQESGKKEKYCNMAPYFLTTKNWNNIWKIMLVDETNFNLRCSFTSQTEEIGTGGGTFRHGKTSFSTPLISKWQVVTL